LLRSRTAGRHSTTISTHGRFGRHDRKDSLTTRLTRLRTTAPPVALTDIAIPSLALDSLVGRASTVNSPSAERRLRRNTLSNSVRCRSRRSGGNDCAPLSVPIRVVVSPWRHWDSGSGSQPGTALRSPTRENLAAALGGHSGAKTMGALSAQVAGLECALHRSDLVFWRWCGAGFRPGTKGRKL
jgi:hypothetical protein